MLGLKVHLDPCGITVQLTIVIAKPSQCKSCRKRFGCKLKADLFRRHSIKTSLGSGSALCEGVSHYESDTEFKHFLPFMVTSRAGDF